jgi:nucleoside-diphosphate-sugar epimerase
LRTLRKAMNDSDLVPLPETIESVEQLEELLSRPTPEVIDAMGRLDGDLIVLGVGGKIGPSLARMARRASDAAGVRRRVIGVARFSTPKLQGQLQSHGIETIRCEMLDRWQLDALPETPNVLYLAAMKFGTSSQEASTWARNAYLPGMVCEKFRRSRIVAYSTGNVYPLTPVDRGGSVETDPPGPVGEYAMSCLGRERVFTYFSEAWNIPTALIRLNYACELRYGALMDIARRVMVGEPIDLAMGYLNVIWQGDNNAMTLRCFEHAASPPAVFNVTGTRTLRVRDAAEEFGRLLGKEVRFVGHEAPDALLSNAGLACRLFGPPTVSEAQLIRWIADWLRRDGALLNKATHFEVRNGKF